VCTAAARERAPPEMLGATTTFAYFHLFYTVGINVALCAGHLFCTAAFLRLSVLEHLQVGLKGEGLAGASEAS
jgi:hypothetical protein